MYALGLYPLITKPTRITPTTATIIDNIFTNDIELKYECGLIIDDSSDHLPIFAICKGNINKKTKNKKVRIRQFLKHRTITTENRYKTYKNKLIAILRKEKKKYYCLLLQENKDNIAGTWKILRTIMGNAHKTHDFPAKLNNNWNMTNDQTNIANMFNGFFTNVGPDLAKNITAPGDSSIFD